MGRKTVKINSKKQSLGHKLHHHLHLQTLSVPEATVFCVKEEG